MYGTLIDNQLHPAPHAVRVGGAVVCNPGEKEFALINAEREAQGLPPYLPEVDTPPSESPTEGWHYEARGWVESGGTWQRQYLLVQDTPPPPRIWTPLSIKRACGERWATVRDALQTAGIYEDFVMAQELREDDAAFVQGYNWACAEYGAEVVDAVLAAAEGGT